MAAIDDFLKQLEAIPATNVTGQTQTTTSSLPATVPFTYRGQQYNIPTAGYSSAEEAIDAFLSQQNEPANIVPAQSGDTNVSIDNSGQVQDAPAASKPSYGMASTSESIDDLLNSPAFGGGAPEDITAPEPEADLSESPQALDATFGDHMEELRNRLLKGAFSVPADRLQAIEIDAAQRKMVGPVNDSWAMNEPGFSSYTRPMTPSEKEKVKIEDVVDRPLWKAGEAIHGFSKEQFYTREEFDKTLVGKLGEPIGQTLGFMVGSAMGPAGTAWLGGGVGGAQQFKDAIASGASLQDAFKAAGHGKWVGWSEAAPIMNVLERMDKGTGGLFTKKVAETIQKKLGRIGSVATEAVSGMIEEAIQETFQSFMNNFDAKSIVGYDPKRDVWQGVGESAEIGGAVGFVLSAFSSAFGHGKAHLQSKASQRLFDEQVRIRKEADAAAKVEADRVASENRAKVAEQAAKIAAEKEQPVGVRQPSIIDAAGKPGQVTAGAAANDSFLDEGFASARKSILDELPPDHGLADEDIDRLANLRADSRGIAAGGQQSLDLGQPSMLEDQGTLPLQRTPGPAVLPKADLNDPNLQQELPLPIGQQGPSAHVVTLKPATTRLYRGLKEGGKARGYPGEFFTEDKSLAAEYARTSTSKGTIVETNLGSKNPFDVDTIATLSKEEKLKLKEKYKAFVKKAGAKLKDGYLYDVLWKGETDFVYPTTEDVEFLKQEGYDAVRFENEGGRQVKSWFLFGTNNAKNSTSAAPITELERSIANTEIDDLSKRIAVLTQFRDSDATMLLKHDRETLVRIAKENGIRGVGNKTELVARIKSNAAKLVDEYSASRDFRAQSLKDSSATNDPISAQAASLKSGTTLYRGSYDGKGNELGDGDLGFHFAPDVNLAGSKAGTTGEVGEFKVKVRNPLTVTKEPANGAWHNPASVLNVLQDAGVEIPTELRKQAQSAVNKAMQEGGLVANPEKGSAQRKALDAIKAYLKQHGYDAIVYPNTFESNGAPSVILLDKLSAKHVQSKKSSVSKLSPRKGETATTEPVTIRQDQEDAIRAAGVLRRSNETFTDVLERVSVGKRQLIFEHLAETQRARQADTAEQRGIDLGEVQKNELRQQQLSEQNLERLRGLRERGELRPMRSEPKGVPADEQLPLPFMVNTPAPKAEPAQGELQFPQENPYNAGLPTQPPAPPAPPSPPSGGGPTAPTTPAPIQAGQGNQRSSLAAVAHSRHIAGQPTTITPTRTGVVANGVAVERPSASKETKAHKLLPKKLRLWLDVALTSSIFPTKLTDAKLMKIIMRAQAENGRALAVETGAAMDRIASLYKASTGRKLEKASREQLRVYNNYLRGQATVADVLATGRVTQDFIDALDNARDGIRAMSRVMLDADMIPAEMRLSVEDNIGIYLSVSYAANVLNQDTAASEILERVPADVRDRWINTFIEAYVNPARAGIVELETMSMGELRRIITQFGILERKRVPHEPDPDTGEVLPGEIDIRTLPGSTKDYDRATKEELIDAIMATDLGNYDAANEEMTNVLLSAFHSVRTSNRGNSGGRDRSIERRLDLARSRQQLADEGYSEREIAHMQSTRELLMETLDPVTNIGITMNKMMTTIVNHRIVNDIASLHTMGMASIGKPDEAKGLTEPLIPRGSPMSDIRIPDPNNPGSMVYASRQTDSSRMGDGVYVSPKVARMFAHLTEANGTNNPFMRLARAMTGWTKTSLTALAPRSHSRNLGTAAMLLALRGHMITNPKALKEAFGNIVGVAMRELGSGAYSENNTTAAYQRDTDKILAYFTSLGLNNDSVRSGPGHDMLTRMLEDQDLNSLEGSTWVSEEWNTPEAQLKKLRTKAGTPIGKSLALATEKAMTAYRLEDEAVKMLAFMVERRRYANLIGRNDLVNMMDGKVAMTSQQLDELREFDRGIAKYITDLYPTYSRVPEAIRAASRNIFITPFPSFTSEMWRNGYNDVVDMINLYGGTGRYENVPTAKRMELFATRTVASAVYYSSVAGLVSSISQFSLAGISAVGTDPTDEELREAFEETLKIRRGEKDWNPQKLDMAIRQIAPLYLMNSIFHIADFNPGEDMTLRALAFTIPNTQQIEFISGGINSLWMMTHGEPDRAFKRMMMTAGMFLADYIKPEVLAASMDEVLSGVKMGGGRVYGENDDLPVKISKSLLHLSKVAVPGAQVYKEVGKFKEASDEGRLASEGFEFMFGINDVNYRIDNLWVNKYRTNLHLQKSINASTSKINSLIRETKPLTKDEFIKAYLKLEGERREAFDDTRLLIRSGEALGLDVRTMQKLVDSTPGAADPGSMSVRDIYRNKYTVYRPSYENIMDSYVPEGRYKMSLDQARAAIRNDRGMIRERLSWIREYRGQLKG